MNWEGLERFVTYLIIIPFSIEKESVGRPAMFHSLTLTGSPRVVLSENTGEQGIDLLLHILLHSNVCS